MYKLCLKDIGRKFALLKRLNIAAEKYLPEGPREAGN